MSVLLFTSLVVILILSIVIHEVSHGLAADYLGDPTARYAGRLTLNPLKHIDPIGSIILPLILVLMRSPILIGWAKPVPINPFNFQNRKYDEAKVGMAGPAANIVLAVVFGLILRFLPSNGTNFFQNLGLVLAYIVWINLLLAIFNLIPIPPLDGSHVLFAFLPDDAIAVKIFLQKYGIFILLLVIFLFFNWLIPIVNWTFNLIVGGQFNLF